MKEYRYYNRDLKNLSRTSGKGINTFAFQNPRLVASVMVGTLLVGAVIWSSLNKSTSNINPNDSSTSVTSEFSEPIPDIAERTKPTLTEPAEFNSPPGQPEEIASEGKRFIPLLDENPQQWTKVKIKSGDSLYLLFKKLGASKADATLVAKSADAGLITKLIPGKSIHIRKDSDENVVEIIYESTPLSWVHAQRQGNEFSITRHDLPQTRRQQKIAAHINSSLYAAAQRAGISDTHIMNLTEIFGWDIDFSLNVKAGDSFKIIFDDVYVDGEKKLSGNILAAEFINNGKKYRAIAHPDEAGNMKYYAPDGTSMQKAFLRSPVKFSRISSRFTKARFHPVLKKWRAHKGVDYAAAHGTPVRATANGKVAHLGRKGGYGKTIIIDNGSTYSTLYAHLSSYTRGLKKGSTVTQGQIIGKVGSTGLASGPHLHYEFRVNGKHVNPLTFRQPDAKPIQASQKPAFMESAAIMKKELDSIEVLQVASDAALDQG